MGYVPDSLPISTLPPASVIAFEDIVVAMVADSGGGGETKVLVVVVVVGD